MKKRSMSTEKLTFLATLSALVVILQLLSLATRSFLPFSISLALIPIVLGSAVSGPKAGAGLGLVCAIVVLLTDAGAFLAINPAATILVVITKGVLCGLAAGLTYTYLTKAFKNNTFGPYIAIFASAIVCPLVNTGIFYIGCQVFFIDAIKNLALEGNETWDWVLNYSTMTDAVIFGLIGINFIIEIISNIILAPTVLRLINIKKNKSY